MLTTEEALELGTIWTFDDRPGRYVLIGREGYSNGDCLDFVREDDYRAGRRMPQGFCEAGWLAVHGVCCGTVRPGKLLNQATKCGCA